MVNAGTDQSGVVSKNGENEMKIRLIGAIAALSMLCATISVAGSVTLTPANPQPSKLKEGLAVNYGYPSNKIRTLVDASAAINSSGKRGKPLAGLSYKDTTEGDLVMTARREYQVAADINGYIKFDAPGSYDIDFLTNDGLQVWIGGQQVALYDGIHGCETTRVTTVEVPEAGWYELKALYFQKEGTSCLMMRMGSGGGGGLAQVPNGAFGYKK
jgi:PA14 domain-containing protein